MMTHEHFWKLNQLIFDGAVKTSRQGLRKKIFSEVSKTAEYEAVLIQA